MARPSPDNQPVDPGSERGSPPRDRDSGSAPPGGSSPGEGTNARRSEIDRGAEPDRDDPAGHYAPPRS